MIDFEIENYRYDFANMKAHLGKRPIQLVVKDGELGWIDLLGRWYPELPQAMDAYSKWLDQQIYGAGNG